MLFNRSEKPEARSQKRATKRLSDEATKGRKCATRSFLFVARSLRRSVAFTLIEIMIVIVILGLLAGLAVYSYSAYLDRAKRQKARTDISVFVGALDAYYGERGQYPGNQEGLRALVPGYIKALPNDPWGRPYQYVQPGKSGPYDIVSYGADGREGGTGADADITNSDKDVVVVKK